MTGEKCQNLSNDFYFFAGDPHALRAEDDGREVPLDSTNGSAFSLRSHLHLFASRGILSADIFKLPGLSLPISRLSFKVNSQGRTAKTSNRSTESGILQCFGDRRVLAIFVKRPRWRGEKSRLRPSCLDLPRLLRKEALKRAKLQ